MRTTDRGLSTVLPISEVFRSFQGEGPSAGTNASFVRLGGCNLSCVWCDSAYTWDSNRYDLRTEITMRNADSVVKEVLEHRTHLVVLTGGEPLLHQGKAEFEALLDGLYDEEERAVEIETNGTIAPQNTSYLHYIVSPKLSHSWQPRPDVAVLRKFAEAYATFKFVVRERDDLDEVAEIMREIDAYPEDVWIMPEGTTPIAVLHRAQLLADLVRERGWNFTLRQHILLWGDERGR